MRQISTVILMAMAATGLAGCLSSPAPTYVSAPRPAQAPAPVPQSAAVQSSIPTVLINAPIKTVRSAIITRAKSRGTTVASVENSGIVLEKELPQSPAALESSCGPHRKGRLIRVLLGTAEQGAGTLVSEQRFVVDDGQECRIQQTQDVVDDANRSLNELKTQSETSVARR